MNIENLDEIIHQPTRTNILVYLSTHEKVDFNTLKYELKLSDGQIATQMRHFEQAGYVEIRKEFISRKSRTTYHMTEKGKENFNFYLDSLALLLKSCNKKKANKNA